MTHPCGNNAQQLAGPRAQMGHWLLFIRVAQHPTQPWDVSESQMISASTNGAIFRGTVRYKDSARVQKAISGRSQAIKESDNCLRPGYHMHAGTIRSHVLCAYSALGLITSLPGRRHYGPLCTSWTLAILRCREKETIG